MTEKHTRISNTPSTEQFLACEMTPVVAVISAVAQASGTDPFELPPLNNEINTDALNELISPKHHTGLESVSFEYVGYNVIVTGCGEVKVTAKT